MQRLGEGVVVRSDDVAGNEVTGSAWPTGDERRRYAFVASFSDDGEVLDCRIVEASPPGGRPTSEGRGAE